MIDIFLSCITITGTLLSVTISILSAITAIKKDSQNKASPQKKRHNRKFKTHVFVLKNSLPITVNHSLSSEVKKKIAQAAKNNTPNEIKIMVGNEEVEISDSEKKALFSKLKKRSKLRKI